MAWTLGENAVSSVLAALQAGMPAKLVALNTEYATSAEANDVLEDVKLWLTSEQELDRVYAMPAVFVLANTVEFDIPRGSFTMEPEVSLSIGVLVEHVEPDHLRTNVYRYTRAMLETIFDARRVGTLGGWQFKGRARIEYSAVLARKSSFIADGTLTWSFTKQEDR